MKIIVTNEDIENGNKRDCRTCPIALAARRVWDGRIIVSNMTIEADWKLFELPTIAKDFVDKFDNGVDVEPFEFEVKLV